jgi:hypothetical protein
MTSVRTPVVVLVTVLGASIACAHELEDNRATLVLRDRAHLSLILHVRYSEAVRRVIAPNKSLSEFLLACATMKPDDLRTQLRRAQQTLGSATRITVNGKQEVRMGRWIWPDAARVQESCQRQVMEATVGGAAHDHEVPAEIRADLTYDGKVETAAVRFADEFGRMLLVWYRANQTWLEQSQPSPELKFP